MYYKINHSGCNERKGLCEIRYDCFLDPGDYGYNEHYVNVPVWPEGGYPGAKNEMGMPVDQADYDVWYAALPRVWQNNSFCCHFMQFEPTVTDAEIVAEADRILSMAYQNWQRSDLHGNWNPGVNLLPLEVHKTLKPFVEAEIELDKKGKPLKDKLENLGAYLDAKGSSLSPASSMAITDKIKASSLRVEQVLATDFEALKVV